MPQIAIVTLTYNNSTEFERTARSLLASRKKGLNFRWIIVDGGSSTQHLKLIENSMSLGDTLIIEKKRGIYRAMNVGLDAIGNESHAVFLNSGDCQHPNFADLSIDLDENKSYCFDAILNAGPYSFYRPPLISKRSALMLPLHSAFLFRTKDSKLSQFETDRQVDADSRWMNQLLKKGGLEYVPIPHSIFYVDGVSAGQSWAALLAILKDKPWFRAPAYITRFLGFKLLGWHLYPILYRFKFVRLSDTEVYNTTNKSGTT